MYIVTEQLIDFLQFVLIGVILSIIFDFFRAYRGYRKVSNVMVVIQDIIYFLIVTLIIIFAIIRILDSNIRLYVFIAIILGISTYISLLSKYVIKLYDAFFKVISEIISIFIIPCKLVLQILQKIYKFFEKIVKKCCKIGKNMISFIWNKIKGIKIPSHKQTKEGKNERNKNKKEKKVKNH